MLLMHAPDTPAFLRQVSDSFFAGNPLYTAIATALLIGMVAWMAVAIIRANRKRSHFMPRTPTFRGPVTVVHIGPEFARPLQVNNDGTIAVAVMKPVTCRTEDEAIMRVDLPLAHWGALTRGGTGILEAKGSQYIAFTPTAPPPIVIEEVNT